MEERLAWYFAILLGSFLVVGFLPYSFEIYCLILGAVIADFIDFLRDRKKRS